MFAQVALGFGLMTEVDWGTLFKTFYQMVRIKVACKDVSKIPHERLFEVNNKLFLISFIVEGQEVQIGDKKNDRGDEDEDDGKGEDQEIEDLDNGNKDCERVNKDIGSNSSTRQQQSKDKSSRAKSTSGLGKHAADVEVFDQDEQLKKAMGEEFPKLMPVQEEFQMGEGSGTKNSSGCEELSPGIGYGMMNEAMIGVELTPKSTVVAAVPSSSDVFTPSIPIDGEG